ncbi:MAG: HAMP domain-containing histidine kinase [Ignavibacteria bacterium]|nr:HAMP domain-containing histidine kinase [Ignavibacteria bacterium]
MLTAPLQAARSYFNPQDSNGLFVKSISQFTFQNPGSINISFVNQITTLRVFQSDYFLIFIVILLSTIIFVGIRVVIVNSNKKHEAQQQEIAIRNSELEKINANILEEIKMRKEAEYRLMEEIEKLKEVNISKDKFFSIISHDLKSPFQGLLGFTELLNEEYDTLEDEYRKNLIKEIRASSLHIYNLLVNVLEWSRLQTNRTDFNPEKVNLWLEIEEVRNLLMMNAVNKNISLHNEVSKDYYVLADDNMLRSILHNLLTNAIKFTEPGGYVKFRATLAGNFYVISVIDNGIGIKQDDIGKIFSIGIQYSTIGTSNEKGTGLGLTLCKEMIEKHGGSIWVESKLGAGSSFRFTMPKYKSQSQEITVPLDLFTNHN